MDCFVIEGPTPLAGRVAVNGSKNASLPLMAAALLTDEPLVLRDVPNLRDIRNMCELLAQLGCEVEREADGSMRLHSTDPTQSHARYEIVKTMRASICTLGPLLAKRGYARVSMPGGCAIGDRPIDLHQRGLEALGAEIKLVGGDVVATAKRLRGATIFLGGPFGSTVLGTANVMSAAVLATGRTVIESAACEPEIVDLADALTAMGARIQGAGTPRITIDGVDALRGGEHRVMPDRIEAGTYMIAAGITRGDIELENCPLDSLLAVTDRLEAAGVDVELNNGEDEQRRATVRVRCAERTQPIRLTTQPFPGYPTDLQAQMMTLLTLAKGNSIVTEKIFPERFLHVPELSRMGAQLYRQGPTVVAAGVERLIGAPVMASDLRASASLVLAGMAAEGRTVVQRIYHLDRGYEKMEERLAPLGARIERTDDALVEALA